MLNKKKLYLKIKTNETEDLYMIKNISLINQKINVWKSINLTKNVIILRMRKKLEVFFWDMLQNLKKPKCLYFL